MTEHQTHCPTCEGRWEWCDKCKGYHHIGDDGMPDIYTFSKDGDLITDDEILREGDQIRLIAVISGGSVVDYPPYG